MRAIPFRVDRILFVLPLDQNLLGGIRFVAQDSQRFVRGAMNIPPQWRGESCQPFFDTFQLRGMTRTPRDLIQHIHDLSALVKDRSQVVLPDEFTDSLYRRVVLPVS